MSSNKSTQSQFSKSPSDPSRVIKPVLQSRKKIEKKPAEIKPISSVSKPSPLRRIEKAKKEPEPNLLTYKEQRDLRARKSDTQKAEKRTMKEIEKIQNTIRKNPSSYELTEEVKETQNVVLTNSRTPSLAGQFNFSEFFNASFNETGSVKDRICKHFVQKIVERQESSEAGIGREGEKEQEKIGFGFGETWNEIEGFADRKVEGKIDTVEDFRPSISDDANLSFEDPNLFMPEIPFFQYNYSNVEILDSEFSCFNEIKQDPDIPLSGTISVLYEIYLDSNIYNVQTTEVFEVQMVKLPSVEPVYYKETGRITINRKPELITKISKPQIQSKLLHKFSFEYLKKPICGLNYDEKPCKKIEILKKQTFSSWSKPLISSLEVQKSYKKTKKVSYYEFSITKAKAVTKPLIVLQESHKKPKKPENPKSLIKPLILEMTHSPILSTEGQMFLFDSQRSIESFNLPLSNQISLEQVPEPQSHESHAVLILVSKFQILLKKALRIQMLQLRRKQDSSLYVIFSLKKKSALFNHLQYWARLLREDKKRCEMIKRNELSDLKMIQKFLNFSATFIQRNWKGFYIRRYVVPSMKAYREFKFLLRSVVVGWKTRKILKTRRMQGHFRSIKDLKLMVYDMSNETKEGSEALLSRMVEEIPKMHSKMIKDFNSLYRTGTWVALLKSHVVRTSSFSKFCEDGRLKVANRDEMPIKPLLVNYEDLPNDDENIQIQPKKVFRNYLKRKTKSVALPENNEKSVNATEEVKEKFECSQNKDMLKIIKEQVDDLEEEIMQEEKRGEGKPKEFLKRKSQSIKPKKLQWNVKRKIDCWVSKEIYNKKSLKAAPATQKDFFCIEELENIFEQSLRNFVDTSTYLKKFDRISAKTKIPQFKHCSEFLFGVKEENYYEILEDLESHYLRLCTQGIRM